MRETSRTRSHLRLRCAYKARAQGIRVECLEDAVRGWATWATGTPSGQRTPLVLRSPAMCSWSAHHLRRSPARFAQRLTPLGIPEPRNASPTAGALRCDIWIPCWPGSQQFFVPSHSSASWRMYLLGEPVRHRWQLSLRAFLAFSLCRCSQNHARRCEHAAEFSQILRHGKWNGR